MDLYPNSTLNHQSIRALPSSVTISSFDTFFTGKDLSILGLHTVVDEILDNIRREAENCDYLSSIPMICDISDGFGGLTCAILPLLREEIGNSVVIPVWGLYRPHGHSTSVIGHMMKENLQRLSLPVLYSQISEYSDLFCPLDVDMPCQQIPHSKISEYQLKLMNTAVLAASIDVVTSATRCLPPTCASRLPTDADDLSYNSLHLTQSQWLDLITHKKRFPIVALESTFPNAINLNDDNVELWPYLNRDQTTSVAKEPSMVPTVSKVMNPFMTPLSLSHSHYAEDFITGHRSDMTPYSVRAKVNVLFCRGRSRPGNFSDLSSTSFSSHRYVNQT